MKLCGWLLALLPLTGGEQLLIHVSKGREDSVPYRSHMSHNSTSDTTHPQAAYLR